MRPSPNVIKPFTSVIYEIFILSYNVRWARLEKLAWGKRFSLVRKLINYGGKKFCNVGP